MKKAREQMDSLNNDERFQSLMTKEEDMEMVLNTEKYLIREDIAKTMLEDNESIEKIMKYTGLTKEEIESIKRD